MVSVKGDNLEELRFYGEGAGKNASANAIVCDVIDIFTGAYKKDFVVLKEQKPKISSQLLQGKYLIRIVLKDSLNSCSFLKLADENKISLQRIEKPSPKRRIFITEKVSAAKIKKFIQDLKHLEFSFFVARIEKE